MVGDSPKAFTITIGVVYGGDGGVSSREELIARAQSEVARRIDATVPKDARCSLVSAEQEAFVV